MKKAWLITVKDLRAEARAKEIAPAMVLFALALVFLFSFMMPAGSGRAPAPPPLAGAVGTREIAGVFIWATLLFAAITGFGQAAAGEKESNRMDGLALAPVDPATIYLAKTLSNLLFLCVMETAVVGAVILFLDMPAGLLLPGFVPIALTANIGMASIGTLFGHAAQHARARALILPLLAFPALLPIILGASRLTSSILTTGSFGSDTRWFILMAVYDIVFLTIGTVTFEFVIQE